MVPAAPELPKFSERYKVTRLDCDLPSHIDHGIIGLMDPAHGPFVHQSEGLKHNPRLMLFDDADRPAKWDFALKRNLIEERRTGVPVPHSMTGPVTLHWRS
ncbi:MAG TPA: hypothetical protein VED66_12250 [Candidatus Sulfotelmatobacter sp.]|nr:hypothetical protein [Candidatus Sulfotelmatobacter sp.]